MKKLSIDLRELITAQLDRKAPASQELLETLSEHKNRMIDSIYILKMILCKSNQVMRPMHYMQRATIQLSNYIFLKQQEENPDPFCAVAQAAMIEILDSMRAYKDYYFDLHQPVPLYLLEESRPLISEKITLLLAGAKKTKLPNEFQKVVLDPFLFFGVKSNYSYVQTEYLLKYIDTFINHLQRDGDHESLLELLISTGFNTTQFISYFKQKIKKDLCAENAIDAKLEMLYDYELMLRCASKKAKVNYNDRNGNVRTQMLNFIDAELTCLQKKRQLIVEQPKVSYMRQQKENAPPYRIKISLPVDALAYLLRLFVESHLIEANPRAELIAFIAGHVQTCGNGNQDLSVNSITTKYKQVTQTTAIRVHSALLNMAKLAKDNFQI